MDKKKGYSEKALYYQKKYNLKRTKYNGFDDETDAFRHTFASASETVRRNGAIADMLGTVVEMLAPLSSGDDIIKMNKQTNMDMWNNSVGRNIGEELKSKIKKSNKKYSQQDLDDIIADAVFKRMKKGDIITNPDDKRMYDVPTMDRVKSGFKQYIKNVQNDLKKIEKPKNEKGKLLGEHIKNQLAHQEKRKKDFAQRLFSKKEDNEKKFDENKLYTYKNEVTGDKKIFLAEMIEQMDEKELAQNKKAIKYQKEKIGIPTEKEAKKAMSNGGMIHVKAYVRGDGTKVRAYYRSV